MEKLPAEIISDLEYVGKVKNFGALGYSPERIANMLGLSGDKRKVFLYKIVTRGDALYDSYVTGQAIGEYNIDVELRKHAESGDVDAVDRLTQRQKDRAEDDLRHKLFGI